MNKLELKKAQRNSRKRRIRARVSGTPTKPRLSVFKSNKYIYAQLIDDVNGVTLAASSGIKSKAKPLEQAQTVGKEIAAQAKDKGITEVVFDRSGYMYIGRVKALADSAREAGLTF